jgi:signal recognition particle GTPase
MFNNLYENLTNILWNLFHWGSLKEENIQKSLDNFKTALLEADVALFISLKDSELMLKLKVVYSLRTSNALVQIVKKEMNFTFEEHIPLNLQNESNSSLW